jgi:hypothetical protein
VSVGREAIYSALFAKAAAASGFTTISRKLKHWKDVLPEEMPYMAQIQKSEENLNNQRGLDKKWQLRGAFYIYVHTNALQQPDIVPSQVLNPILDDMEDLFKIDDVMSNVCTLGGLVSRAWIDGTIETSEGTLGDREVAIVPWCIVVPAH